MKATVSPKTPQSHFQITMNNTIIQHLADLLQRYRNGQYQRYLIKKFVKDYLPSGSGLDGHIDIDYERTNDKRIVIDVEYHHMNEVGMYDGWTNHSIIVTPHFIHNIDIRITGKNRNDVKDYLHQTFICALQEEYKPYG